MDWPFHFRGSLTGHEESNPLCGRRYTPCAKTDVLHRNDPNIGRNLSLPFLTNHFVPGHYSSCEAAVDRGVRNGRIPIGETPVPMHTTKVLRCRLLARKIMNLIGLTRLDGLIVFVGP